MPSATAGTSRLARCPVARHALRPGEDAGLTPADIDGVATYPGAGLAATPGFTGPGAPDVQDALRLKVDWLAYRTRNSRDQYESPTRTAVKPHPPTP